ncbi:glycosyltransferase family 69 [Lecanosticta acicola]|uniref:Glycosyltransferase family 69 n=1 Tax=Lecanosticta acicola TaxID=111012 RepID=A0AAI8Z0R0_9PEZI|nr:glycosyltransferase family 69 [Lecanosticta acicola]
MDSTEPAEEEALLYQVSSASSTERDDDSDGYELDDFDDEPSLAPLTFTQRPRWWRPMPRRLGHRRGGSGSSLFTIHPPRRRRALLYRAVQLLALVPHIVLSSIILCGIFFPSYSYPPERYLELRARVQEQGLTANTNNEKVFIAASLYDREGEVVSGLWGQSVLHLIDILGKENVFLSIYENDPDEKAQEALDAFAKNVTCESAIVTEELDLHKLPHVSTPDGHQRLKRIAFLADVRNRALRPLEDVDSKAYSTRFDKLLYLNDVVFDPIDAANLLFSTNVDEQSGRTQYRAACAIDFINPFKFYDTFATRDLEGNDMGVVFYPWFTGAGEGESRKDVLQQKDAVRVKSCWGGMVAFEARWFQQHLHQKKFVSSAESSGAAADSYYHVDMTRNNPSHTSQVAFSGSNSSLRFRAETDTYWDASECCLIHADLSSMDSDLLGVNETGIYMNPYIRVAYSASVLPWLSFTKRFERLYTPVHSIINWIAERPSFNPRQLQQPGDEVTDSVWVWHQDSLEKLRQGTVQSSKDLIGHFEQVRRKALPGGFCGMRKLLYINEDPSNGQGKWASEKLPLGGDRKSV